MIRRRQGDGCAPDPSIRVDAWPIDRIDQIRKGGPPE
jgi:hypothetical protein